MLRYFKFIDLFRRESDESGLMLVLCTVVAGLSTTGLLAVVNAASHTASYEELNFQYLVIFILIIAIFALSQRYLLVRVVNISEEVVNKIRRRLARNVQACDFYALEQIGHEALYSKLTRETAVITQTSPTIMNALQSATMVIFSMAYIAYLSFVAFVCAMVAIVFAAAVYYRSDKRIQAALKEASDKETELFGALKHVLAGFKENKLNASRAKEVLENLADISESVEDKKVDALTPYATNYVFVVSFFYVLVASVVFILPALVPTFDEVVVKLTTAMLFLIGPLSNLINLASIVAQSNCAVDNLSELETLLDAACDEPVDENRQLPPFAGQPLAKIELRDAVFEYHNDRRGNGPSFKVGPMSLAFERGEIVFITGGNGSGKSTFLKLLCALYHPASGEVFFNDACVTKSNAQFYRDKISAIFCDFHMFDKLYGLRDASKEAVDELLDRLKIANKTSYKDGRFSNLDLSTGQRKRLAFLVSFLEDREVYVFDEWAADQDPQFKKFFYEVLLQDLKSRGKTVIAVTHDDNYFYAADRLLKMDYGKFVPIEQKVRKIEV